ncbi:Tc toxin subunit A-related protein [Terrimonas alba]|uniref:Tc toxin subunit A-related protein n=1 Tax=Terrimonas alba TaxID=3349636 RepID=UPI0035F2C1E2
MERKIYSLKGQIVNLSGTGIPNLTVQTFDADLIGKDDSLVSATTDVDGYFEINFSDEDFREKFLFVNFDKKPDIYFKIFKDGKLIKNTRGETKWDTWPTDEVIKIVVDVMSPIKPDDNTKYSVSGYITSTEGFPASNLIVKAFDKDLRSEELLGETVTNDQGLYHINYSPEFFTKKEKGSADILMRVYDDTRSLLYESSLQEIIWNAAEKAIYNIQLKNYTVSRLSEFETVQNTIRPVTGDIKIEEIREDDEHSDISFLSAESGISFLNLEYFILAHKLAAIHGINPQFFYALFRQNTLTETSSANSSLRLSLLISLQGDLTSLWLVIVLLPAEVIKKSIEEAIALNTVASSLQNEVEAILDGLLKNQKEAREYFDSQQVEKASAAFAAISMNPLDDGISGDVKKYIDSKLNAVLKEKLKSLFAGTNETIRVIESLNIDYRKVADLTLQEYLDKYILPYLQKAADKKWQLNGNDEIIKDLLNLNLPLKKNPLFNDEIRSLKVGEYARLSGIEQEKAAKINAQQIDPLYFDVFQSNKLLNEGILTEEENNNLFLTFSLGKLTDDHLPLIRVLKEKSLFSARQLVGWEQKDWLNLLQSEKISSPNGEKMEEYIDNMMANLKQAFPSMALLLPTLADRKNTVQKIDSVLPLLKNNSWLFQPNGQNEINWSGIDDSKRAEIKNTLDDLLPMVNTYKHLGIREILKDEHIDIETKKNRVASVIDQYQSFINMNPFLDLHEMNLFDEGELKRLRWKGIDEDNQKNIVLQLKAYQRTLALTGDDGLAKNLLQKGFDSAQSIIQNPLFVFKKLAGISETEATYVYDRAGKKSLATSHLAENLRIGLMDRAGNGIRVSNWNGTTFSYFRQQEDISKLFGSQDFCDCEHCRSVVSPAAYFVEIMFLIEQHITEPFFQSSPNHRLSLKNRRPDLWKLELTCENTNKLIPYLEIVNETLESFLEQALHVSDIYQRLNTEQVSFNLPFNIHWEELRNYLTHFSITLYDVFTILKAPDEERWRERLNISPEEYDQIIVPAPNKEARKRFGILNDEQLKKFKVKDFLKYTGISRSQLDDLLPHGSNKLFCTHLLDKISISQEQDESTDPLINYIEYLLKLDDKCLDFIHRFIRLWKRTGWTIREFDMVVTSLNKKKLIPAVDSTVENGLIDETAIQRCAQLVELQERLKLKTEELPCLYGSLPNVGLKDNQESFFVRLFSNEITSIHFGSFIQSFRTHDSQVNATLRYLLAGLGISETELVQLLDLLEQKMFSDGIADDVERISILYRHAMVAKAFRFSIEDLVSVLRIRFDEQKQWISSIDDAFALIEFEEKFRSIPFSINELLFILKSEEKGAALFKLHFDELKVMTLGIQKAAPGNARMDSLASNLGKSLNITAPLFNKLLKTVCPAIDELYSTISKGYFDDSGNLKKEIELKDLLSYIQAIERLLFLFSKFNFKDDTVNYILDNKEVFGISFDKLRFEHLCNLNDYVKQVAANPTKANELNKLLANRSEGWSEFSELEMDFLAETWKMDKKLVESFNTSGLSGILPSTSIQALNYINKCLSMSKVIGISYDSFFKLATNRFDELGKAKDIIIGAFVSKYPDEKLRADKLEPYRDRMNVKKRDALCDFILANRKKFELDDLHDLYAYFLLDVEMSGCFRTSRMVAAISSLQLYVHRCLMNLEREHKVAGGSGTINIAIDTQTAQVWEWKKNYRVWEANEKVRLYPENYILPELRDDTTPIFKELEDELLQQKITKESAEAAYKKYLSRFGELARLKIAGSYYHEQENTYYFFGRTNIDPPQMYYRKWVNASTWTPWEKVELAIDSPYVSCIKYQGRLSIFWTEVKEQEKNTIYKGRSLPGGYLYTITFKHAFLNENNKWSAPQNFSLSDTSLNNSGTYQGLHFGGFYIKPGVDVDSINENDIPEGRKYLNRKYFPLIIGENLFAHYYEKQIIQTPSEIREIDLFNNIMIKTRYIDLPGALRKKICIPSNTDLLQLYGSSIVSCKTSQNFLESCIDYGSYTADSNRYTVSTFSNPDQGELKIVGSTKGDFVFRINNQQYLFKKRSPGGSGLLYMFLPNTPPLSLWTMKRISTSLPDKLGQILFTKGVEEFLAIDTQKLPEDELPFKISDLSYLGYPVATEHIDFKGAYGIYYQELFFHIPFLIASHLNAEQKFKEADWWYRRIFDPTSQDVTDPEKDRNWQYIEFRKIELKKMYAMLTDPAALEASEKDPFNPHAIARLRLNAYQKTIVMKYIDNLLDWGDSLFAEDTVESINEATMLYILASDILGERPVKLGKCKPGAEAINYDKIGDLIANGSDPLVQLENFHTTIEQKMNGKNTLESIGMSEVLRKNSLASKQTSGSEQGNFGFDDSTVLLKGLREPSRIKSYEEIIERNRLIKEAFKEEPEKGKPQHVDSIKARLSFFCVPNNEELLKYWDRVNDRLFKIRNCMNISGIRRQLALFQPPIDPMMLVKAKAAGLSLEDILSSMNKPLPPYRFSFLLEKARQFTQTVQGFGSALLSALEKKDVEELTLIRSVNEKEILNLTIEIKKKAILEAQNQHLALQDQVKNVQNRVDYYNNLIESGLNDWEGTEQKEKNAAKQYIISKSLLNILAGIIYQIPQTGSPFAMKYGGKEGGDSLKASGVDYLGDLAAISEVIASCTGLEASFQRREQEWEQQLTLAQQELLQVQKQVLAADFRAQIAERDLEIHQKNIEHNKEVEDFYKNKFTNLGLYNYLSTTLTRLYREAYKMAYEMAKMAEQTYRFERDDNNIFILPDNWQFDKAGLLAGEKLMLQLQRLEKTFIENNRRNCEINQSFSLALLNPSALLNLKQTGSCKFEIPELAYDILYPGQYKRIIKSVRLTIPCIAGPYTNISTKLSLVNSWCRKNDQLDTSIVQNQLESLPYGKDSITTSSAQNDSGMFELNFRDERYLPFEGAGAVSEWKLELPNAVRSFDYNTISDVVFHISYTANDGGDFRSEVEKHIRSASEKNIRESLNKYEGNFELFRLFSMKHDFPTEFYKLLHPGDEPQQTSFQITANHLPYWLSFQDLKTTPNVQVFLRPKKNEKIFEGSNVIAINNSPVTFSGTKKLGELLEAEVTLGEVSPFINSKWNISSPARSLKSEDVDDLLILFRYKLS